MVVGVKLKALTLVCLQREAQYQKERAEAAARAAEQERLRAEDKEKRLAAAQAHASSLEEKIALLERQAAQALARISPSMDLHKSAFSALDAFVRGRLPCTLNDTEGAFHV